MGFFDTADDLYAKGKGLWGQAIKETDKTQRASLARQAADLMERALNKGCTKPMSELGAAYLMGMGREVDYSKGFHISLYAAENGSGLSANNVAVCYANGYGTEKNAAEAVRWWLVAAEKNYNDAFWPLAQYLSDEKYVTKNLHEARKWGRKAVEAGRATQAQYDKLFRTVPEGMSQDEAFNFAYEADMDKDYEEALVFYNYAAEKGSITALNNLGVLYSSGHGIAMDKGKAVELYGRAAAKGCKYAKTNLAIYYFKGDIVVQNLDKAKFLLVQAMEEGHERADALYKDYFPDEYDGVAGRIRIAQGKASSSDYYYAAELDYREGNYDSALNLALKAWNEYQNIDACLLVAEAFLKGNGVEQSIINFYRWILVGLNNGLPKLPENLAKTGDWLLSLGLEENLLPRAEQEYLFHAALALLHLAAMKNNAYGELKLATCYTHGYGCAKNDMKAMSFLRRAAEHGDPTAIEIMNKAKQ